MVESTSGGDLACALIMSVVWCVCQANGGSAPQEWWRGPHQGANEGWRVTGPQANSNEAAMWPAAGRADDGRAKVLSWNTDISEKKTPLYCLSKYRNSSLRAEQRTHFHSDGKSNIFSSGTSVSLQYIMSAGLLEQWL